MVSFLFEEVVLLINVLIIKYDLFFSLREVKKINIKFIFFNTLAL